MPYLLIANIIAGIHSAFIIYFLGAWLIPFAPLKLRATSALVIGTIFAYFYFFSACPLTTWEYYFRSLGGETVDNRALIERLSQTIGFEFSPLVLKDLSLFIILGMSIISLSLLVYVYTKQRSKSS